MIYFVQPIDGGPIKIGCTSDLDSRLASLESCYRQPLVLLATMRGGRAKERAIHERFAHLRFGRTEQFRPAPELADFIGKPLFVSADPDVVEAMKPAFHPIASFKGSDEFRAWFDGLAEHCRDNASALIEKALVAYAKQQGYDQSPPSRR